MRLRLEWHRAASPRSRLAHNRTLPPWLGSDEVFCRQDTSRRRGTGIAQDAVDLADRLALDRFDIVGHDWGARAAYTVAALFPERVTSVTALALAGPGYSHRRAALRFHRLIKQGAFWYQWFLCVDGGAARVQASPVEFARIQWETWSPPGCLLTRFAKAAEEFFQPGLGPDHPERLSFSMARGEHGIQGTSPCSASSTKWKRFRRRHS